MSSKIKLTGIIKVLIFLSVLILIGAFSLLYFVKNKISDVTYIKELFHSKYNLSVSCEEIKTDLYGLTYVISSPYFSFGDGKSSSQMLDVKDVKFKVKILPVLFGKISVSEIFAKEATININRLEDGNIDILKYLKFDNKSFLSLDLSKVKVDIKVYKIKFNDLIAKNNILIDGYLLKSSGLDIEKKFSLDTEGAIFFSNDLKNPSLYRIGVEFIKHKGKLSLKRHEVILSSINTNFLKNYFQKFGLMSSDAIVDIYSTALDNSTFKLFIYIDNLKLAFNYKNDKNTMLSNKPVISELDFNFSGKDLILKKGKFLGDNINILYSGKIKNFISMKNIEPELEIKVEDTYIKNLVQLLPDTIIPFQEPYIKSLKMYNLNGSVNGFGSVKFKNKDDFNVIGKLDFWNLFITETPKNAPLSFAECEFKGKDVEFRVFANAPNNAVAAIFGKTKMQKLPPGDVHIKSFGNLDMEFALKILKPVQKTLALKLGPLPFMTLKGDAKIDLHTKGTKEKAELDGWFETDNATVAMQGLNAVLTNGKVKILFNKDKINFNNATGFINNAKASIDGFSNTNGDINFDIDIKNIQAKSAMKIAQTSKIVLDSLDGGEFLKSFKPKTGNLDFHLNLTGNVPPDAVFGEPSDTVYAKGKITFKGVNLLVEPKIQGTNLYGTLDFAESAKFNLKANVFDSPFKITGSIYQKGAKNKVLKGVPSVLSIHFVSDKVKSSSVGNFINDNLILFVPENRLFAKNLAQIFLANRFYADANVKASGLIYPNQTELDLSKFDFSGNIKGKNIKDSDFLFKNGSIVLKGKNVKFDKLKIFVSGIDFLMDGTIDKFASIKPFNNLKITFFESDFISYVDFLQKIMPEKCKGIFSAFSNYEGKMSGKIKLYSDKIDGEFVPEKISLFDKKTKNKIVLKDGKIKFKNEKTYLKAFNILYGELPVYIDGFMQTDENINPEFNLFLTTNISESACDKLLNPYLKYPVLLTGEAVIKARIQGRFDAYTTSLNFVLNEGSDMSFMGFKFKDTDSKREVDSKIKFLGNTAYIDHIKYFKYVASQNKKLTPYDLIKISGAAKLSKGDFILKDLRFETPNPAPVRFLNLFFKKSLIKDGLFTSNLTLNGSVNNIKATGDLTFSQVFLPMYDSIIDKIKIKLSDDKGKAEFSVSVFDTPGDFIVEFQNKTSLPVVINNVAIHSNFVSIDNLMKAFATFANPVSKNSNSEQANLLTPSDIRIEKGNLLVDKITFNGIEANNLKLNFSHLKNGVLKIDDAYLSIAGGLFKGSGKYNFETRDVEVQSDFIDCDANELTRAFFNLSDQIYGNANGELTFVMKEFSPSNYLDKINVNAQFEILNGRLPKLGSIEYLLRASSFFKSGIFGLTLNNIIDLLTPYKHGDFNKISGTFKIKDLNIEDLKIYSQGDNLSTYTYGDYDIKAGVAQIEVLGKLSKKVSNLLGPIGNASVVSVLNAVTRNKMDELVKTEVMKNVSKIPLMDLNNDDFRLFNVKLKGVVTTDDIVKSFTWLN